MDGYNELAMSPNAGTIPGGILYRFEAPLLFFNADYFKARVLSLVDSTQPQPRWFVLSAESISQLDTTGAQAVDELPAELQTRGVQLMVARPKLYMRKYGRSTSMRRSGWKIFSLPFAWRSRRYSSATLAALIKITPVSYNVEVT
jgi:MFS superfamily sulfate permease-like transporter